MQKLSKLVLCLLLFTACHAEAYCKSESRFPYNYPNKVNRRAMEWAQTIGKIESGFATCEQVYWPWDTVRCSVRNYWETKEFFLHCNYKKCNQVKAF